MKPWTRIILACALAAVPISSAPALEAQSASELMESYAEVYQERLEGIEDLLVVQTVMGFSTETYFEKVVVDGTAVLQPRMMTTGGTTMPIEDGTSEQLWGDPSGLVVEFSERAEIDGTEEVAGVETTVIRIDDLSDLELVAPGQGQVQQNFVPRTVRVYLDTDEWLIHRMETVAEATTPQGTNEVEAVVDFTDYRDVGGMPYPHRMTVSVSGLEGAVSEEEMAEARQALEQMRTQLENMPEDQRRMVEGMMGDQMEQLLQTLESGSMTMEVVVEEARVNEGPPEA